MKMDQQKIRERLKDRLESIQRLNPSFSLRAFAGKLGVSAGNLSQFLSGKKDFSIETINTMIAKIEMSPEERKDLLKYFNSFLIERIHQKMDASVYESRTLTEEEFIEIGHWHFFAIRSILSLKGYRLDIPAIAAQLGIAIEDVSNALEKMQSMGILEINDDGEVRRLTTHLKTPDNNRNNERAIAVALDTHEQAIEHAKYSLRHHPRDQRDITWVNIPANSKKFEKAQELIRIFQDEMLALLEDGDQDQVMRLTIQLCPLLRRP